MKSSLYRKQYRSKGLSTRKLFLVASVVFASAIAVSATSTYALYSISEKFRITGLRMEINHDATFKLGKKNDNGEIVYNEDEPYSLRDFGYENPMLGNISNMFHTIEYPSTYDDTFLPYFYKGYQTSYIATKTSQTTDVFEEGYQYVQLEFYVLCSEDAYIYLGEGSAATPSHEANLETARQKDVDVSVLDNVTNASRVSFYSPYGYVIAELGEHEDVTYAGRLDLEGDGYFDSVNGKEILYGSYEGSSLVYGEPLEEDVAIQGYKDIFHADSRAGNRLIDENESDIVMEEEVAHPLSYYVFKDAYSKGHPVAVAKANTPTRLVVSIYLEGWDHDMTSALTSASFGFELGFVAVFDPSSGQYLN